MSKMREAFKAEYGHYPSEDSMLWEGFKAGYQAAIADVKAGGAVAKVAYPVDTIPYAHLVRNCDLSALAGTKLYKLPEDV